MAEASCTIPTDLAKGILTSVGTKVEKSSPVKKMKLLTLFKTENRPILEKTITPAFLAESTKPSPV